MLIIFLGKFLLPEDGRVLVGNTVIVNCNDGYRVNGGKEKSVELICQVQYIKIISVQFSSTHIMNFLNLGIYRLYIFLFYKINLF